MKLLNLGCGGHRPGPPWINLDTLMSQLKMGTAEMENLLYEKNYIDCDVLSKDLPFQEDELDGILCQHVLEHMCAHDAVMVLQDCRRVLKPGGIIVCSVPDASYFLKVYSQDTRDNAVKLFGEPIHDPVDTFFDYALFRHDHIQILTRDSLICLMLKAGFTNLTVPQGDLVGIEITKQLNRIKFSVIQFAYK